MTINPIVSFCIPTYNRSNKVSSLVKEILLYEGEDIEVVVLDNCSSDSTSIELNKINDYRFSYIRNEENIGGTVNPLKALSLAKGKYAFLCLDKDLVFHKNIAGFVKRLKSNPDIFFGHCILNIEEKGSDIIYEKGFLSLENMAYLSEHPSGSFYNAESYKKLNILNQIFAEKKKFGFYIDLINAEMSFIGDSMLICLPLVNTETKEESAAIPSHTYTEKDLFFSPAQRMIEYSFYIKNLTNLSINLQPNEIKAIVKRIYNKATSNATIGFRSIMLDNLICTHYGINTRKVNKFELLTIHFRFSLFFLNKKMPLSRLDKLNIFFAQQKSLFSKFLKNEI